MTDEWVNAFLERVYRGIDLERANRDSIKNQEFEQTSFDCFYDGDFVSQVNVYEVRQ